MAGGNDVFVDIGDKSWGVRVCQHYFGEIDRSMTLHVGDQFLSAGANDFKVLLLNTLGCLFNSYFLYRHELLARQRGLRIRARQCNCWMSY